MIKSILTLTCITFVLTIILYYLTHLPIWALILFSVIIQFIINYIFQECMLVYIGVQAKRYEVDMAREQSFQTAEIECPCSLKVKQGVNLRLNETTQYQCFQCQKTLNVAVEVTSTLATIPTKNDAETFDNLLKTAKEKAPSEK